MKTRTLLTLILALAAVVPVLGLAGPTASVAQAKPVIGLADQDLATLSDPRFQQSGIKRLRIAVSYDQVRKGGKLLARQDAFFSQARAQGINVLVSFYRTSSCSPRCAARRLPTVKGFRSDFRRFRQRYPWIKSFSTWNEQNYPLAQPTGRNPKRAGQFYLMLRKECRGKCSVLTGDFRANGSKFDARWLKTFRKTIGGGSHKWGLIAYPDVNKYQTKYTRKFLRDTKRGSVYVTEVGALNVFGRFYKPSLTRQNKAMKYTMTSYRRVSRRIKAMYLYQWRAGGTKDPFDSALISTTGVPRPAYYTFFKYLGRKAP
jgi:hypothetical protein